MHSQFFRCFPKVFLQKKRKNLIDLGQNKQCPRPDRYQKFSPKLHKFNCCRRYFGPPTKNVQVPDFSYIVCGRNISLVGIHCDTDLALTIVITSNIETSMTYWHYSDIYILILWRDRNVLENSEIHRFRVYRELIFGKFTQPQKAFTFFLLKQLKAWMKFEHEKKKNIRTTRLYRIRDPWKYDIWYHTYYSPVMPIL